MDELDSEQLPALIAALAALQARAAARLIALPPIPNGAERGTDDSLIEVHEAARIAHHSESWMRKNGHTLPGFWQPRGRGTAVGWKRRELEKWANGGGVEEERRR